MVCMCGVCGEEIATHEAEKSQDFRVCPDCGKKHYIGERNKSLTTIRCGCGVLIYEEGGGFWHEHPNKGGKDEKMPNLRK